jgi:hypothetical protein
MCPAGHTSVGCYDSSGFRRLMQGEYFCDRWDGDANGCTYVDSTGSKVIIVTSCQACR